MSSIVFIGGGNMASCIMGGMIARGFEAKDITATAPSESSQEKLKSRFGISATDDNRSAVSRADIV